MAKMKIEMMATAQGNFILSRLKLASLSGLGNLGELGSKKEVLIFQECLSAHFSENLKSLVENCIEMLNLAVSFFVFLL